jgi:hypothetical protein
MPFLPSWTHQLRDPSGEGVYIGFVEVVGAELGADHELVVNDVALEHEVISLVLGSRPVRPGVLVSVGQRPAVRPLFQAA